MAEPTCCCGSGSDDTRCCRPILAGKRLAATAEQLMRSRFAAFAVGDVAHLLRSWAPETRPVGLELDGSQRWTRLEVIDTVDGRELAATGIVEFRAHYEIGRRVGSVHERSRFRRHEGRWVYIDGTPV